MARLALMVGDGEARATLACLLEGRAHDTLVLSELDEVQAVLEDMPDLLIVDAVLGGGSGLEAVAQVRRQCSPSRLPIILLSGDGEEDYRRGFASGATDCLSRGVSEQVLMAKVAHFLRGTSQAPRGPALPAVGEVLFDRYRLEEILGEGSYGAVYGAFDAQRDERVALKILYEGDDGWETRERFMREVYSLGAVRSPFVARIHESGNRARLRYCTMELVRGPNLQTWAMTQGPCSEPELVAFLRGIARGLDSLHSLGLVHRDIKPANIILRGGVLSQPVLVDFGIAKGTFDFGITAHGVILGTPGYMAPEILSSEPDARSDLFSLGHVGLFAATGRDSFSGEGLFGVDLLTAMSERPASVPHHLSPPLRTVLKALTAIDPNRRVPSAWELLETLSSL